MWAFPGAPRYHGAFHPGSIVLSFVHCSPDRGWASFRNSRFLKGRVRTMVAERREIETRRLRSAAKAPISPGAQRSIRKFRRFFPGGYRGETYIARERDHKWVAHKQWTELLDRSTYRRLLQAEEFSEIALRAVRIESRTNLLFSFERWPFVTP